MRDINIIFSELAQYQRMSEEITCTIETLKDEIKAIMAATNNFNLVGSEHTAKWSEVNQSKLDTSSLKKHYPDIVKRFTIKSSYKRFTFK